MSTYADLIPMIDGAAGLLIGGETVAGPRRGNVTNPATGKIVAAQVLADPEHVNRAVSSAAASGEEWSRIPGRTRGSVLLRWAALLREHREALAQLATAEMGKPLAESRGEVERAASEIEFCAGEAPRMTGQTIPGDHTDALVITERAPLGVVAAITPWNFPLVAPVRKIAPALASGDTVVVKPAQETPLSALAVVHLLDQAGLASGAVAVLSGEGSVVGQALIEHEGVAGISFTGSTSVGRRIAETAGRKLTPVQLELGGKNPAYVDSTVDIETTADEIVSAAMQCTGQRCTSISRVIVEEEIADELVTALSDRLEALPVGVGTDPKTKVGPLVSSAHCESVAEYIRRGLNEGATRVTSERPVPEYGPYLAPVLFDHVRSKMSVAQDEIFGPVLSVLRVRGVEEAIEVANDTAYGLAASVFSTDINVALRFLRGVDAGMVHVNHGTSSEPHAPFGGVRSSGMGAFSIGDTAREFYTRIRVGYLRPGADR